MYIVDSFLHIYILFILLRLFCTILIFGYISILGWRKRKRKKKIDDPLPLHSSILILRTVARTVSTAVKIYSAACWEEVILKFLRAKHFLTLRWLLPQKESVSDTPKWREL